MSLKETQVFAVKNVVNNNIVIVHDFNGREMVAIGKGLGFKKKKHDLVYPDEVMKTYVLVNKSKTNLLTLFEEVPFDIIEVSQQIIDYASEILNAKYNVNLLTGLADHIHFSVSEYRKGNSTPKLVSEEVKRFYKDEYQVGLYAVDLINEKFDIKLQKDEATSIAFHLITATESGSNHETRELMQAVRDVVDIVERYIGSRLDQESFAYSRFVIHLKFFFKKVMKNQASENETTLETIFNQLKTDYVDAEKSINEISDYVLKKFGYTCTDNDCIYLLIHIVHLYDMSKKQKKEK